MKKMTLTKNWANNKKSTIFSNWHEVKAILLTHGLIILTKFHYNWAKIVDLLLLAHFLARVIFFVTVSI